MPIGSGVLALSVQLTPLPSIVATVCPKCGDFVPTLDRVTGFCGPCSTASTNGVELWLAINANAIEHYMVQGNTLPQAITYASVRARPTCVVCSEPIKHARKDAVFCKRHHRCRTLRRRYIYLYSNKGLTKTEALASILNQLGE